MSQPPSAFTARHLSQMVSYIPTTPLRVVAHIDLDAFYAQCEMVRLGIAEDVPLAVQQWQGLIAINYPARNHGISRHATITDALKLCPTLVAQHVATWREGSPTWAYRPDAAANVATDKVSLDPYRLESRRILSVVRESLPAAQRVEKASIDEVFLDLSAQVHGVLLARYPELSTPGDPSERLPAPSVSALDWAADHLIPLSDDEEALDPDWDDIAVSIGAEIVRDLRAVIRSRLGYTCSAGVAHNKLLSKLGSGHNKPNQQTIIRRRAVAPFLAPQKFTKIRNLGGKLGEQVAAEFDTEEVSGLLGVSLQQMTSRLGPETGTWVHNSVRGIDNSEVNPRTKIKSMLSAKAFRPAINSVEQAERWIYIFSADIHARLVEEGVLENRRRPKTVNLSLKHANQTRSRQTPIAPGKQLDQPCLMELGKTLLAQFLAEGEAWPCNHLSMAVSGFEDGLTGNMGIGTFLVRGTEAQALRHNSPHEDPHTHGLAVLHARSGSSRESSERKRRHSGSGGDIERFFTKPRQASIVTGHKPDDPDERNNQNATSMHDHPGDDAVLENTSRGASNPSGGCSFPGTSPNFDGLDRSPLPGTAGEKQPGTKHGCPNDFGQTADQHENLPPTFACDRCNQSFADPDALQSHNDWHMAMELQEREEGVEERVRSAFANRSDIGAPRNRSGRGGRGASRSSSALPSSSRQAGGRGKTELEPGQRRLQFG